MTDAPSLSRAERRASAAGAARLPVIVLAAALGCGSDPTEASTVGPRAPAGPESDASVDEAAPLPSSELGATRWERLPDLPTDSGRVGSESVVVVDGQDRVLVSYGESAAGYVAPHALAVHRFDGAAWTVVGAPIVASSSESITRPRMAVSSSGTVFLAYVRGGVHVHRLDGEAWTELSPPPLSSLVALVARRDDEVTVVGTDALANLRESGWTAVAPPPGTGALAHAALADDSALVVLVNDENTLRVFSRDGASWAARGAAFGARVARSPFASEIAIDASGAITVAWSQDSEGSERENVFGGRLEPAAEAIAPFGALGGAGARYAQVRTSARGRTYVAWREIDGGPRVRVVSPERIDLPPIDVPRASLPCLALDRRDLPVVSWETPRDGGGGSFIGVARAVPQ